VVYAAAGRAEEGHANETIGEEVTARACGRIGNFQALVWHPEYLVVEPRPDQIQLTLSTKGPELDRGRHRLLVSVVASSALAPTARAGPRARACRLTLHGRGLLSPASAECG